jgi:hypothetical protein
MRLAALLLFAGFLLTAAPALAEQRTFIVPNDADGYGVDRCLATGASCGIVVATAYCRAQDFAQALSFRKIARVDVTGSVAANAATCPGACEDFVAIECGR